jgi:hypothetical protein
MVKKKEDKKVEIKKIEVALKKIAEKKDSDQIKSDKAEENSEKKVISIQKNTGWEQLAKEKSTTTLDTKIAPQISPAVFQRREKLENALRNIPEVKKDENKNPYDTKQEQVNYGAKSQNYLASSLGNFQGTQMKRAEEMTISNQPRTFTHGQLTGQQNVYDMKRNAEETLNKNWGVEGLKKYEPIR